MSDETTNPGTLAGPEGVAPDPLPLTMGEIASINASLARNDPQNILFSRDIARIGRIVEGLQEWAQELNERHVLIQGQMQVIERQLDAIVSLVSKIGTATLPVEAKKVSDRTQEDAYKKWLEAREKEENDAIEARGGDHPPTPEEIAAAEAAGLS